MRNRGFYLWALVIAVLGVALWLHDRANDGSAQPPPRTKHGAPVTQFSIAMDELNKELGLGKLRSDTDWRAHAVASWPKYWSKAFDEPVEDAAKPAVRDGSQLPAAMLSIHQIAATNQNDQTVLEGITNPSLRMNVLKLGMLSYLAGPRLADALRPRLPALPPTKADLLMYQRLVHARWYCARDMKMSLTNLYPMATAKNPVYRLLALEFAPHAIAGSAELWFSESDLTSAGTQAIQADRCSFLRNYRNETDRLILSNAVAFAEHVGSPESKELAAEFRAKLK
jgi:hypothetical protein